jgi:hypothetical protein
MLLSRPMIVDGDVWGAIYTLEKAGDVFGEHVHTGADNHITALLFGSIRCTGHPKYEGAVLQAKAGGTIVNWTAGEPHGFVALTDGATIMNIRKA